MISIVIPVYNGEKYLKNSIESILYQTYMDWEMIVIDNGSTDSSLRICQSYAKQDDRIHVLHQHQNRGVSVARNLGMEKAGGEYLTFLDADDWVLPDYLEQLLRAREMTKADMLVCEFNQVYDVDRELLGKSSAETAGKQSYAVKIYNQAEYMKQCVVNGTVHCWGVLYTRRQVEDLKFPAGLTIGEDMLFLVDAVFQAKVIAKTEYEGYQYYSNREGAMNRKYASSYRDQILCWQKAKEKITAAYPELTDKLNSILVVSAMLVAGKLALLDEKEQKENKQQTEECYQIIKEYGSQKNVVKCLPAGYPAKVKVFRLSPKLYLKLYGLWKG